MASTSGRRPSDAAWRELFEETGLGPDEVELVGEYPEWTIYEWPPELRDGGRRHARQRLGQVQRWFVFRVRDDTVEPTPDGIEFGRLAVGRTAAGSIDQVVEFRRPSYERVLGGLDGAVGGMLMG